MRKQRSIKLTKIRPYWRNPRDNNSAVNAVAQSMKEFDVYQPLVLDKEMVIIVGDTRYKAAKQLGMESMPCVIADDLTKDQVTRLRIIDNKTSELAKWDQAKLVPELREILDVESMQIFFGQVDISNILNESVGSGTAVVTGDQVQKQAEAMANKFSDMSQQKAKAATLELTCPYCEETFSLNRDYVIELMGLSDETA